MREQLLIFHFYKKNEKLWCCYWYQRVRLRIKVREKYQAKAKTTTRLLAQSLFLTALNL